MNSGKTAFTQVMDFLPLHEFRKCVSRYRGDYKARTLSCLDQFLSMSFAQMTYRLHQTSAFFVIRAKK